MTVSTSLVKTLATNFPIMPAFSDISFVVAYENEIKPTPVSKPIVAFSIKGCEIGERLTETLETGAIVVQKSREMLTTLSVDIYLPYSMGGNEGHSIFERIATQLLFVRNYDITKVTCGDADYDKSCEAIVVRSKFVFKSVISS